MSENFVEHHMLYKITDRYPQFLELLKMVHDYDPDLAKDIERQVMDMWFARIM